jgi:hypothetical protein
LAVLLQSLEMNQSSGQVTVYQGSAFRGCLWLQDGRIVDGRGPDGAGADVLYALLQLESGEFRVDFGNYERPQTIQASTQALLLEGMRRLDESQRLTA